MGYAKPDATVQDLHEAIGGLLLVLGSTAPASASKYMAEQLTEFADHCIRNGKANAGTFAKGFAKALADGAGVPPTPKH